MYTLEKKKEIINRLIPDKNLQDIIFMFDNNTDNFMQNEEDNIKYFYNLLVITTAIIYKAFIEWNSHLSNYKRNADIENFNNSSIRQYNLLRSLYDTNKLDIDFIENLLSDVQIDASLHHDDSFLKMIGLNNFVNIDKSLSKYIYDLKQSRLSERAQVLFKFENLEETLKNFRYVGDAVVEIVDSKYENKLKEFSINYNSRVINLDEILMLRFKKIYVFEDFSFDDEKRLKYNSRKEQKLVLNYVSLNMRDTIHLEIYNTIHSPSEDKKTIVYVGKTCIERFLINYGIFNFTVNSGKEHFFKDYISFNNKYIKYFSLIISDVVSIETKQYILSIYGNKYSDIFDKLRTDANRGISNLTNNGNVNNYKWDEIIVFLLLEEGIFNFLSVILKNTKEKYSDFIRHYHLRFPDETKKIIQKYSIIENPTNAFGNAKDNVENYVQALIFLTSQLFSVETIDYESLNSLETIVDKINDIKQYKKYDNSNLRIAKTIIKMLSVLNFVYIFYSGILAYIEEKSVNDLSLKQSWFPSYEQYRKKNKEYLELFSKAVADSKKECGDYVELNKYSISKKFYEVAKEKFNNIFEKLNTMNNSIMARNEHLNQVLYDTLGKREIFSSIIFANFKERLFNIIDELSSASFKNETLSLKLVDISLNLLYYLGGYSNDEQNLEDAIYPVIGTYSNGIISEDGYRFSIFKFVKDSFNNYSRVKFVIDDDFDFNETYFCLPHINRTTKLKKDKQDELIWVSPIVIPYKFYCNNFIYDEDDSPVIFEGLQNEQDFNKAAELLYYTDEMIYGSLFGNVENAKKVLVKLFDNQKSVFFKDYIYIVKEGKNVVGISTLYKYMPKWSADQVIKAFYDCKLEIPNTIEKSYLYFEDTFNDTKANMFEICDICIDKDYRRKGYAKFLLDKLNDIAKKNGRDLLITVYKDNDAAINLYTQLGFLSYSNDYDNRGIGNNPDSEYLKLIKYNVNRDILNK